MPSTDKKNSKTLKVLDIRTLFIRGCIDTRVRKGCGGSVDILCAHMHVKGGLLTAPPCLHKDKAEH